MHRAAKHGNDKTIRTIRKKHLLCISSIPMTSYDRIIESNGLSGDASPENHEFAITKTMPMTVALMAMIVKQPTPLFSGSSGTFMIFHAIFHSRAQGAFIFRTIGCGGGQAGRLQLMRRPGAQYHATRPILTNLHPVADLIVSEFSITLKQAK